MDSHKSMWIAFAVGAVAGGVTALLAAPDKGSRTRRRLVEGTRHVVDEARTAIGETTGEIAGVARAQKDAIKEAATTAKDAYKKEVHSSNRD
jgi:gas vesicle protein